MRQEFITAFQLGPHPMPGIWRAMLPSELAQLRFPEEKQANCAACPKACHDAWRPDYRCCTYHPRIPNFLLGLALQTPAGERAVDELIERGMLLPEGMHASPRQWLDFLDDQDADRFGRSLTVLCPMLDTRDGLCRVHVFRNAVCSTYFCHKDQGSAGEQFWSLVQTLGTQLEMRLGQWSLQAAGFDLQASLDALNGLAPHIDRVSAADGWEPWALQKIWGAHAGREKELLRACAQAVLDRADELWSLAQDLTIVEAEEFDQALMNLIPPEQRERMEEEEGELEAVDLEELWEECREAHAVLWAIPEGTYTLSPLAQFTDSGLDYRFQDPAQTLAFQLQLTDEQKRLLQDFRGRADGLRLKNPDEQEFLRDMVHRKVLWTAPKTPLP